MSKKSLHRAFQIEIFKNTSENKNDKSKTNKQEKKNDPEKKQENWKTKQKTRLLSTYSLSETRIFMTKNKNDNIAFRDTISSYQKYSIRFV
jgi:hypothetical protein